MELTTTTIRSARLDLITLTPAMLDAALAGDLALASQLMGLEVPEEWLEERDLIVIRRDQVVAQPNLQPWLLRAIGLRAERRMIGHFNFHTAPGPDYLQELAPGGVELGYTIFESFRRRGFALEASQSMMDWAHREHGVTRFIVSISPTNVPSLGMARKLGFHDHLGQQIDEEDGPEDIFERRVDAPEQSENR